MNGKCPHCNTYVMRLVIRGVPAAEPGSTRTFNALTYHCPSCQSILSCSIDPIAIKTDTVNAVVAELRDRR